MYICVVKHIEEEFFVLDLIVFWFSEYNKVNLLIVK